MSDDKKIEAFSGNQLNRKRLVSSLDEGESRLYMQEKKACTKTPGPFGETVEHSVEREVIYVEKGKKPSGSKGKKPSGSESGTGFRRITVAAVALVGLILFMIFGGQGPCDKHCCVPTAKTVNILVGKWGQYGDWGKLATSFAKGLKPEEMSLVEDAMKDAYDNSDEIKKKNADVLYPARCVPDMVAKALEIIFFDCWKLRDPTKPCTEP